MKNQTIATGWASERQSGIEALRIVAMSMILIWHFVCHGLTKEGIPHNLYYFIQPFIYSGVNIFFLISGHFLIKLTKRSIAKNILIVLFFYLLNIILVRLSGGDITISEIIATFIFPISKSQYWFINVYILLLISAPIVNAGLKSLPKQRLLYAMLVFIACAVYMRGDYFSYSYLNGLFFLLLGLCTSHI
jgi:hypothetical protein